MCSLWNFTAYDIRVHLPKGLVDYFWDTYKASCQCLSLLQAGWLAYKDGYSVQQVFWAVCRLLQAVFDLVVSLETLYSSNLWVILTWLYGNGKSTGIWCKGVRISLDTKAVTHIRGVQGIFKAGDDCWQVQGAANKMSKLKVFVVFWDMFFFFEKLYSYVLVFGWRNTWGVFNVFWRNIMLKFFIYKWFMPWKI